MHVVALHLPDAGDRGVGVGDDAPELVLEIAVVQRRAGARGQRRLGRVRHNPGDAILQRQALQHSRHVPRRGLAAARVTRRVKASDNLATGRDPGQDAGHLDHFK